MRVAIGSDHAGFPLKEELKSVIERRGEEIIDVGTDNLESVDYPDFAEEVALALLEEKADRGIFICGSGVGGVIAANKVPGIQAGLCHDTYSAGQGVEHDDMNILVLGGRVIGPALAYDLVDAFLNASYLGGVRFQRRLDKVRALEARYLGENPVPGKKIGKNTSRS